MKILYVLVLYQQQLEDSITYQSLMQHLDASQDDFRLLIYDNSPTSQLINTDNHFSYYHDKKNGGIQAAYQYGFDIAKQENISWICFLDQDTKLSLPYLTSLQEKTLQLQSNNEIVGLVPKVNSHGQRISPTFSNSVRPLRQKQKPTVGINAWPITAIASGTCLKTAFISSIDGFHSPFQLDYFDHWLFWKIRQQQKKVFVLEATLEHDLSVLHYQDLSVDRYCAILHAENLFYQKYATTLWSQFQRQLLLRSIKQLLTIKNKKIAKKTLQLWFKNCFHKKKQESN